jgi:hypothetical protein
MSKSKTTAPNLLAQKAVLAAVNVSMWTARRYDASVTEETNRRNHATPDAGRYNKLLVDKIDIKELNQIRTAARQRHYMLTQPWLDDGSRLLPAALYMSYVDEMRKLKVEYDAAADTFAKNYAGIIKRAKSRLNGMFNEDDYPSPNSIRNHFGFDIKVMPCPDAKDFRVDIAQEHLSMVQQDVEERMRGALDSAMQDVKERITKLVGHMAERLKAYKPGDEDNRAEGLFRDSLVENVRELVALLPAFNLTGDAKLTALTKRIESELCLNDADTLRENDSVRGAVAKAADKILTDVAAFMS